MTTWGYARVSTVDQNPGHQFEALRRAGVDAEHIVTDHASGSKNVLGKRSARLRD